MTKQEKDRERRQFERHCKDLMWEDRLERDADGNYAEDYIDTLWLGWMLKVECTASSGNGSKK
jgi:hypothetical protein